MLEYGGGIANREVRKSLKYIELKGGAICLAGTRALFPSWGHRKRESRRTNHPNRGGEQVKCIGVTLLVATISSGGRAIAGKGRMRQPC